MKKVLLSLTLILTGIQAAQATVSVRVCGPNEVTVYDPNSNIMVGQELTLIVNCDSNDYWSGSFFIEGNDRALGTLSARDSDPNVRDCTDSHYPAAGDYADVFAWRDSDIWGFDMYSSDSNCVAGDWFIIDYKAEQAGTCDVDFYDYNSIWTEPNITFTFRQDPSCDFNEDGIVNLIDFNQLSYYWLANCNNCADVNDCLAVDLDFDLTIDVNDLTIFVRHWLWDGNLREPETTFAATPDPNIIYSVVDANGLDEIYLNVGESIRLYVDYEAIDQNDLINFDIEIHISDPNAGSIDNAADPNGTAEILATPRSSGFDLYSPGIKQNEGIRLAAIYAALDPNNPSMNVGHLASFVYTATNANDVELSIVNNASRDLNKGNVYPTVNPIIIHHVASQPMSGESAAMMELPMSVSTTTEQLPMSAPKINNTIDFLEMIYREDEGLQNIMNETEWENFINSLSNPYLYSN